MVIREFGVVLLLSLVLFMLFAFADILSSSSSFSFNQSISNLYNITVNNTDVVSGINFTQVNLTFPSQFILNLSSNGTSSSGVLTNGSNILIVKDKNSFFIVVL